jgi:hypothetical protein
VPTQSCSARRPSPCAITAVAVSRAPVAAHWTPPVKSLLPPIPSPVRWHRRLSPQFSLLRRQSPLSSCHSAARRCARCLEPSCPSPCSVGSRRRCVAWMLKPSAQRRQPRAHTSLTGSSCWRTRCLDQRLALSSGTRSRVRWHA